MAAVNLSFDEAEREVAAHPEALSVAVSNSPSSTVLAGDPGALTTLVAQLESRGVFARWVQVDIMSRHSPQMDSLLPALADELRDIASRPSSLPMCSTATGRS